ncbi:MAG: hypothetical protein KJ574_02540 [Nanoarchaeota archaeon]|nr:hypothetical protein [Nanoarchaeota archaeon]
MSLILPMIERALEQGENDDEIITSLICSGYERDAVVKTLRKVKLN